MTPAVSVRFRVDFGSRCSIGVGKVELLEGIARSGSLSQAAREMRMSYRRAWLLVEQINNSLSEPAVTAATGGAGLVAGDDDHHAARVFEMLVQVAAALGLPALLSRRTPKAK